MCHRVADFHRLNEGSGQTMRQRIARHDGRGLLEHRWSEGAGRSQSLCCFGTGPPVGGCQAVACTAWPAGLALRGAELGAVRPVMRHERPPPLILSFTPPRSRMKTAGPVTAAQSFRGAGERMGWKRRRRRNGRSGRGRGRWDGQWGRYGWWPCGGTRGCRRDGRRSGHEWRDWWSRRKWSGRSGGGDRWHERWWLRRRWPRLGIRAHGDRRGIRTPRFRTEPQLESAVPRGSGAAPPRQPCEPISDTPDRSPSDCWLGSAPPGRRVA